MFYVIQQHHNNHKKHYLAYVIIRYIAAKNTHNIIFEINQNGLIKRKWSPKEDIILLTDDKDLFRTTLERLESIKNHHLEKIDAAQEQLNHEISHYYETMQKEFEVIKSSDETNTTN